MSSLLLESIRNSPHLKDLREFKAEFKQLGIFYENVVHHDDFIFNWNELERYVIDKRVDPADADGDIPENHVEEFKQLVAEGRLMCFEMDNPFPKDSVVGKNYEKYEVYIKD